MVKLDDCQGKSHPKTDLAVLLEAGFGHLAVLLEAGFGHFTCSWRHSFPLIMKVKDLLRKLKKQNPELPVKLFAHDHDPRHPDEGDGPCKFVDEVTDDAGETFVCLKS